ncbi:hypothetical protein [Sporomusa rhizae]|uniref:hypothetical protein n=1 Tax=Sporomusa rhizae TaxID=357999 RepID=UPI00352B874B
MPAEVEAVQDSDEGGTRIGGKDLVAVMIAQVMIVLPVILLFGFGIGVVIWGILSFWSW